MNAIANTASVPAKAHAQFDYILVDSSGSMIHKWEDSLKAINAYVQTLKWENIHSHLVVHTFDSTNRDYIQRDVAITDWEDMHSGNVWADFTSTPLYDAIQLMCMRLRDLDPELCAITIVTDGDENTSQFTDLDQAKAFLAWCRAKGWTITFLGAEFNNRMQAKGLGMDSEFSMGVSQARLSDAMKLLAKKRATYGRTGDAQGFTDDEKQQFGGYLNPPEPKE